LEKFRKSQKEDEPSAVITDTKVISLRMYVKCDSGECDDKSGLMRSDIGRMEIKADLIWTTEHVVIKAPICDSVRILIVIIAGVPGSERDLRPRTFARLSQQTGTASQEILLM
jgi:hypothetical protein